MIKSKHEIVQVIIDVVECGECPHLMGEKMYCNKLSRRVAFEDYLIDRDCPYRVVDKEGGLE